MERINEILSVEDVKKIFCECCKVNLVEEEEDWIQELENSVYDEHEYVYVAYREKPSSIDYENVPFGKKRHFWFDVVYDGFDFICEILKNNKK